MRNYQMADDVAMLFTDGGDWHLDLWGQPNAVIVNINLYVYSPVNPNYAYNNTYFGVIQNGNQTQFPIDAARLGNSTRDENVRVQYVVNYMA